MNRNCGKHSGIFLHHCWSQYQNVPQGKKVGRSFLLSNLSKKQGYLLSHSPWKKYTFSRVDERIFLLCCAAFSTIVQFLVLRVFSSPKHNQDGASQPGRPQYSNAKWTHALLLVIHLTHWWGFKKNKTLTDSFAKTKTSKLPELPKANATNPRKIFYTLFRVLSHHYHRTRWSLITRTQVRVRDVEVAVALLTEGMLWDKMSGWIQISTLWIYRLRPCSLQSRI